MALGVCPECDKLVAIMPGDLIPGRGRARVWHPVDHVIERCMRAIKELGNTPCRGAVVDGKCARCAAPNPPVGDVTTCFGKPIR